MTSARRQARAKTAVGPARSGLVPVELTDHTDPMWSSLELILQFCREQEVQMGSLYRMRIHTDMAGIRFNVVRRAWCRKHDATEDQWAQLGIDPYMPPRFVYGGE